MVTLSVDEQIDKLLEDNNISKFEDTGYYGVVTNKIEDKIKSLIRQVCEEVIGQNEPRIPSETNNLQSKKRRIRNAIKDEQRTKLNKLIGRG